MKKTSKHNIMAFFISGAFLVFNAIAAAPDGWLHRAFGEYQQAGSGTYVISGGQTNITIVAEGTDIWAADDYGRYTFTPMAGDCEIIATVPFINTNSTDYGMWVRAGVMMRGSTMHGAQNISIFKTKGDASGNRTRPQRRLTIRGGTASWTGVPDTFEASSSDVRYRLRRQGDTFTAWSSTNAPAYDQWIYLGTETYAYPSAMNLGVALSRWQNLGSDTITHSFLNVVARKLVNASGYAGGITVDWISDTPVQSGSIVGYTVNRAPINSDTFTELAELGPAVSVYSDTTAGSGTTYVYRVNALVEDTGPVTNVVLVGDSLQLRKADSANPTPAPVPGLAALYYDTTALVDPVGARVDPYINDSWGLNTSLVYPVGTGSGLTDLNYFRGEWNGSIIVEESGCYEISMFCDDHANIYINGERLVYQNDYQGRDIFTAPFYLEAGRVNTLYINMQENSGGQAMQVRWFKADGSAIADGQKALPIMQGVFEPFPRPWEHKDLGDSPLFGNASFDESDLTFRVAACLGDIDNQHLIWQKSSKDFDLLASAELTNAGEAGVNAGVTVRSAAEMGAQAVSVALVSSDGAGARNIAVTIREADNGAVTESTIGISESIADLRLSRRGDSLLACYRTLTSGGWVIATNLAINLPDEVCVGMQSYTATDTLLAINTFTDVSFAEEQIADLSVDNVANLQAVVSTVGNPALQDQERATLPTVAWYWYSAISDVVDDSYTVLKSDHWENNYSALADLNAGNNYTYTDTLAASNTIYFYTMSFAYDFGDFADSSTNDLTMASDRIGVSDGSIDAGGTGLYNAYYRGAGDTYFPTNTPVHVQIRDLSTWNKGGVTGTNPMVTTENSDDGQQVGPDGFSCSWSGFITPPYTGYYSFRTSTDDAIVLYVGGQRLLESYNYAKVQTSADVHLEAGVPVPVFYYFQQGNGSGYFEAYWKHGFGTNAEYVEIPATCLTPLAPENTPFFVDPAGAATFGNWKNMDIGGPTYPGHAVMGGTPEAFDLLILGSGADIWGTADQFHYVFQETSKNFALEGTIDAYVTDFEWAKVGLMLRESTAPGSRHIHITQSYAQGRRFQYRPETNGTSAGYDGAAKTMMNEGSGSLFLPTNFKIVRKGRTVTFFLNDQPVPLNNTSTFEYDISSWGSDTILAGLCITSHENDKLVQSMFNDVTFTVLHNQGSVIIMR